MNKITSIFEPIISLIAYLLFYLHKFLNIIFNSMPSLTWIGAICLLVIIIRALTMPVFIKQMKSMGIMQKIQPKLRSLQKKYQYDKMKLQQETMKLYKEHNVNPFSGCLPFIIQAPFFLCLYQVIRSISLWKPHNHTTLYGPFKDHNLVESIQNAKLFTVPIIIKLFDSKTKIESLNTTQNNVYIVITLLIIFNFVAMFLTNKYMMHYRNSFISPNTKLDSSQQQSMQIQKIMLYVGPIVGTVIQVSFPLANIIYFTITNCFTFVAQFIIFKKLSANS